jgi:hypothetical protein
MALERWLLNFSQQNPEQLPDLLLQLLEQSNNVAITSVVASIAMSNPEHAGPAGVSLLTNSNFFHWDLQRKLHDETGGLLNLMPSPGVEGIIYYNERKEMADLPHRREYLENLAQKLQLTDQHEKVFDLIDQYISMLPPEHEQDDEMRLWRLRLYRIDLRGYKPTGDIVNGGFVLSPGPPPADIQQMLDDQQPEMDQNNQQFKLLMWGINVFNREKESVYDPSIWREMLKDAQKQMNSYQKPDPKLFNELGESSEKIMSYSQSRSQDSIYASGSEYIVVVCIRDHWDELTDDEKTWCVEAVLQSVESQTDAKRFGIRSEINPMDGARPSAYIIPSLFNKHILGISQERLLIGLASALLHANDEICSWTAKGCDEYLWRIDRELALCCAYALLRSGRDFKRYISSMRESREHLQNPEVISISLRQKARELVVSRETHDDAIFDQVDLIRDLDYSTLRILLQFFGQQSDNTIVKTFIDKAVKGLAEIWQNDETTRYKRARKDKRNKEDWENYDIQLEELFIDRIILYCFSIPPDDASTLVNPLAEYVSENPRRILRFLQHLILAQDYRPKNPSFWTVWQLFADNFISSGNYEHVDNEYSDQRDILRSLMLCDGWKTDARDWPPLINEAHRIISFFQQLPFSRASVDAYIKFLSSIGSILLPDGLTPLAKKIKEIEPQTILSETSVFYLESILSRLIFGGNTKIRHDSICRNSVLLLLDVSINSGSSLCYRLRDDFLTPFANK